MTPEYSTPLEPKVDVTRLRSALENWGRHFDWCVGKSMSVCTCGLTIELAYADDLIEATRLDAETALSDAVPDEGWCRLSPALLHTLTEPRERDLSVRACNVLASADLRTLQAVRDFIAKDTDGLLRLRKCGPRIATFIASRVDGRAPIQESPSPTPTENRFAHWSADLLSGELRKIAADVFEDDETGQKSDQGLKLRAAADRLDALYFGAGDLQPAIDLIDRAALPSSEIDIIAAIGRPPDQRLASYYDAVVLPLSRQHNALAETVRSQQEELATLRIERDGESRKNFCALRKLNDCEGERDKYFAQLRQTEVARAHAVEALEIARGERDQALARLREHGL